MLDREVATDPARQNAPSNPNSCVLSEYTVAQLGIREIVFKIIVSDHNETKPTSVFALQSHKESRVKFIHSLTLHSRTERERERERDVNVHTTCLLSLFRKLRPDCQRCLRDTDDDDDDDDGVGIPGGNNERTANRPALSSVPSRPSLPLSVLRKNVFCEGGQSVRGGGGGGREEGERARALAAAARGQFASCPSSLPSSLPPFSLRS